MSKEYLDIVDESGNPTGEIIDRDTAHKLAIRHRTAHIWIIRENNNQTEVLLQKRSQQKDCFPGCLDTSSAGHISSGDLPLSSAIREVKEELSIQLQESDLNFIGTFNIEYQRCFHNTLFKDNEIAFVYLYDGEVDIDNLSLQKEELESVCWIPLYDLKQALLNHDERFCVVLSSVELLEKYLTNK